MLNLNKEIVDKVVLKYPHSLSEQTAIATILSDCDKEISSLEEKRDKYKELKQGMMQQLLTGKIRLIKKMIVMKKLLMMFVMSTKK